MATYAEIYTLKSNAARLAVIEVCIMVAAQAIMDNAQASPAARKWARQALYLPTAEAQKAWNYVLAKNVGLSVTQINNAADNTLQNQVNAVVPALVAALAGT